MYPFPQQFLLCLGFFLYLPAAAAAVLHLARRGEMASRTSQALAFGAALSHVAFLTLRGVETGAFPIRTGLESLILFLVALTALVLVMGRVFQLPTLVSLSLPLIALSTGGSFLLVRRPADTPGPHPLLLASHISLTVLSYAAFGLGFITGVMYLIQERQLKSRRPGRLFYLLPALEVMEQVSARTITAGYVLLTAGIALGAAGIALAGAGAPSGGSWFADPKVVWTLLTWVVYTAVVLIRLSPRFRGRKVAMVGVLGFVLVIFTYFGAQLAGSGFHRF